MHVKFEESMHVKFEESNVFLKNIVEIDSLGEGISIGFVLTLV